MYINDNSSLQAIVIEKKTTEYSFNIWIKRVLQILYKEVNTEVFL